MTKILNVLDCTKTMANTGAQTCPLDIKEVSAITTDSRQIQPQGMFIAIKGARSDGHAYIDSCYEKGALCCISEQELPHIWERYYKSDKSHNRAIKGSGLGLSIVRSIAELHAGSCGAGSEPGKGSTFWIEIPLYDHSGPA